MDDCYLEAGHRGLHFVENRNYGMMVTYRSISKKCFLLKRPSNTISKAVKNSDITVTMKCNYCVLQYH